MSQFQQELDDALSELLGGYDIPYEPVVERIIDNLFIPSFGSTDPERLTECNCGCDGTIEVEDAIWGKDDQPYITESHMNAKLMRGQYNGK